MSERFTSIICDKDGRIFFQRKIMSQNDLYFAFARQLVINDVVKLHCLSNRGCQYRVDHLHVEDHCIVASIVPQSDLMIGHIDICGRGVAEQFRNEVERLWDVAQAAEAYLMAKNVIKMPAAAGE